MSVGFRRALGAFLWDGPSRRGARVTWEKKWREERRDVTVRERGAKVT